MENDKLIELKNRLAMLPGLLDRLDKLRKRLNAAEQDVKNMLHKFEEETLDVEQLKKESFSATLFKLIGKYEGRLDKESQEALAAKNEYDRAIESVRNLRLEYTELGIKASELKRDEELYKAELSDREETIRQSTGGEAYLEYKQLETERESFTRQLMEIDEAINAANKVRGTLQNALESLESAEDWATYDVWSRGGIISHMAKYEHIDNAEECFNKLSCQLKYLQEELSDVNVLNAPDITIIDSTTRTFDFWFDNIFTDLSVRDKICEDIDKVHELDSHICGIIDMLNDKKTEIVKGLNDLEIRKDTLLINIS